MSVFGLASIETEPLRRVTARNVSPSLVGSRSTPPPGDAAGAVGAAAESTPTTSQQAAAVLSKFVLWLPGEVVAGYAAAVAMTQTASSTTNTEGQLGPWLIALVATPVLLWVVALAKKGNNKLTPEEKRVLSARVFLSIPAFALWSVTIPLSAWTLWFDTSDAIFWFVMLLAGAAFTAIAEFLVRRVGGTPPSNDS